MAAARLTYCARKHIATPASPTHPCTGGPYCDGLCRPKLRRVLIGVQCNECGKKWKVGPNSDPQCPKCNGVDYEVL